MGARLEYCEWRRVNGFIWWLILTPGVFGGGGHGQKRAILGNACFTSKSPVERLNILELGGNNGGKCRLEGINGAK